VPNPNLKKRVLIYTAGTALIYSTAVVYLAYKYVQPSRQNVDTPTGFVETTVKGPHGEAPIWTKEVEDPKAIVIFAHGYGGTRLHWPKLMEKLAEAKISSVAIGMPGQEESPMPQVGFGGIEADIITDVANEIRSKNPKTKIILYGVSLGGASTWIAAGRNPEIAHAVVTAAAYANLNQTSRRYLSLKLPAASPIPSPRPRKDPPPSGPLCASAPAKPG
jgi:alpha-beta hydrolase superfamily lysophospholipase